MTTTSDFILRNARIVLADRVIEHGWLAVADGRIAEIGTHDELLRRGGLYAQLWSRQSGGFLDEGLMQAVGA